jgi:hypothetical protein
VLEVHVEMPPLLDQPAQLLSSRVRRFPAERDVLVAFAVSLLLLSSSSFLERTLTHPSIDVFEVYPSPVTVSPLARQVVVLDSTNEFTG